MKKNFKNNMLIIKLLYVLFLLFGFYFIFTQNKQELHLAINSFHSSFFDTFFKYTTHLGDGLLFPILVVFFFISKNKALALKLSISGILTLLFTSLFKRIIFKGMPRPIEFLGQEKLHLIDGVKMAHWNTFPSGHTTAAFAIATVLILNSNSKLLQFVYFFLALLAGFSRVYLSQHFLVDVLAGSALGIFVGLITERIYHLIRK